MSNLREIAAEVKLLCEENDALRARIIVERDLADYW